MDASEWGATTPGARFESMNWGVGLGELDTLRSDIQSAAGSGWGDIEGSIHGAYGSWAASGKSLVSNAGEYGYGYVYETNSSLVLVYDDAGEAITHPNGMIRLPNPSMFQTRAWTVLSTADLP